MTPAFLVLALVNAGVGLNFVTSEAFTNRGHDAQQKKQKPLTLVAVEQLIQAGAPDDVIAQEVLDRGIVDVVTREVLLKLRSRGAGPRTIQALTQLLPRVSLALQTTAGAQVMMAGRSYGMVPDSGELTIRDLEPGLYRVVIRKQDFATLDRELDLRGSGHLSMSLPLEPSIGFLTVNPQVAGSRVSVDGVQQFGRVEGLRLSPGVHRVTVTAPLHNPLSLEVTIVGGKVATPEIRMTFSEREVGNLNIAVQTAFANRRFKSAVDEGRRLEQLGVLNTMARSAVAMSLWELRDYAAFAVQAQATIRQDGQLTFSVVHHHRVMVPEHPAKLTVSQRLIGFDPLNGCSARPVSISSRVVKAQARRVADNNYRANLLAVGIDYPNPTDATKTETLNLLLRDEAQIKALLDVLAYSISAGATPGGITTPSVERPSAALADVSALPTSPSTQLVTFRVIDGALWRSADGKQTWARVFSHSATQPVTNIAALSTGHVFALAGGQVFKSADFGTTWTVASPQFGDCRDCELRALSPAHLQLLRASSVILETQDAGGRWERIRIPFPPDSVRFRSVVLVPDLPANVDSCASHFHFLGNA
jgi:hypothetical protein